ncbi:MAG: hypothetical protein ACK4K7_12410 [Allosphingosinicella sp.]|uniref:hypothetical protein n=1 Tax=Allosphingosinicella sp. TaxID=2823234 RepID=UPI00393D7642
MKSRVAMFTAILAAALALSACGQGAGNDIAALDNELTANDTDPALTSALEDQILVDPALAQQSNRNAVRPPETPVQAQYPVDQRGSAQPRPASAAAGQVQAAHRPVAGGEGQCTGCGGNPAARGEACGGEFQYGLEWAGRLPAAFPPYPGGRLTDAAGNDRGDCRVRVVTFETRDAPQQVLGWYRQRAEAAGFSAEQQSRGGDIVLGGVDSAEGAFYLIVTPKEGGADVALIVNRGS